MIVLISLYIILNSFNYLREPSQNTIHHISNFNSDVEKIVENLSKTSLPIYDEKKN